MKFEKFEIKTDIVLKIHSIEDEIDNLEQEFI
jgi:hypothetical protein